MSDQQSSYRQIMKATSIFGGVQVFTIIVSIIRSKFIAVLLGPAGMGILGLLNSTISLIAGLTNLGLGVSAVKDVAAANATGNKVRVATAVKVLKRWVWITGLLGTVLTLVFSSWLSRLTFGNSNYTFAFALIALTLLFKQLTTGQLVVLQGLQKLQYLAKANMVGSALGLLITVPFYYKFGVNGIVPGIIISALISFTSAQYFARKVAILPVKVSRIRTIAEGKSMLILGFMISLSGLIAIGTSYLVRIFIGRVGGIDQVGLYTAGFAIINTYTGLIFTAMATDYFPRLSAVAHNDQLCTKTINQQAEIALLILAPILIGFLIFIKFIVTLLYSSKFIDINPMIHWAALGIFFKAASWAVAFQLLAKGKGKLFFWNELIVSVYMLVFNLFGYYYWGLTGLGISFLATYVLYFIQVYVITRVKFDFQYEKIFMKIFLLQFSLASISFFVIQLLRNPYAYIVGSFLIIISIVYSFLELNKRLDIRQYLSKYTKC